MNNSALTFFHSYEIAFYIDSDDMASKTSLYEIKRRKIHGMLNFTYFNIIGSSINYGFGKIHDHSPSSEDAGVEGIVSRNS